MFRTQMNDIKDIPINEFTVMDAIHCQRAIEPRLKRCKKNLLENPQPTQHQVDIFRYPSGEQVVANGNTRSWVWKELLEGEMEHQVPDKVFATIYDVKNKKEAEDLYYTMDSLSSVEKTNDIITGIYRKLGFLNTLVNSKIKRGHIIKSLEFAAKNKPYFDKDEYKHNKPAAFGKIVLDFKDEILTGLSTFESAFNISF